MTIIDTTLYLDGQLRLARHGAGRGGNVLTHVESGDQLSLSDDIADILVRGGGLLYVVRPNTTARYNFDVIARVTSQ